MTVSAAVGIAFHTAVGMVAGTAGSKAVITTAADTSVCTQADTDAGMAVAWLSVLSALPSGHSWPGGTASLYHCSIICAVLQIIETLCQQRN